MTSKPELRLDWCSHEAAKYAVENWHYSRCLPAGKAVRVGVWESGRFIGVVIFSRGASSFLGKSYGLTCTEVCELTRVALDSHFTPVSRIMAIAIGKLRALNPGTRMIISFADPRQGHVGAVYQAGNWIYSGLSEPGGDLEYLVNGKWTHGRSVHAKFGFKGKALIAQTGFKTRIPTRKHRYLMPLDSEMRQRLVPLAKPYPKRERSAENGTAPPRAGGGVIPTRSLHESDPV